MSDAIKAENDRLRTSIARMLRRVPRSVLGGSYDTAVAYKRIAAKAGKQLEKRDDHSALRSVEAELAQHYQSDER